MLIYIGHVTKIFESEAERHNLLYASAQGATQISIYSSDSDVLVLALRRYPRYPDLCSNSCFVTRSGSSRRVINLKSFADTPAPTKTAALAAFHAFTRADVTGRLSGKGKATCWG